MCGRYNLIASEQEIVEHFQLPGLPEYEPGYNITPSQPILNVVQLADGSRKGAYLQWGLLPSWCKDPRIASHMINARRETLAQKPAFRSALKKRRCLIPATGFYEWQQTPTGKQPYHIHRPDNSLFAFAGLWEHWENETESIYSCSIVTTAANPLMQPVHARMPVIVAPQNYPHWLDRKASQEALHTVLDSDGYAQLQLTPISTRVNNPAHNDPDVLKAVALQADNPA